MLSIVFLFALLAGPAAAQSPSGNDGGTPPGETPAPGANEVTRAPLAVTGASIMTLVFTAVALTGAGLVLVSVGRRSARESDPAWP